MKAKEIISILSAKGIAVSKKKNFYDGSGYGEKYTLVDSPEVDGKTAYLGIPTKVKAQGFLTKRGELQNFFCYSASYGGFKTFKDIDSFLKFIGK